MFLCSMEKTKSYAAVVHELQVESALKNAGLNTTQHWVKYGWTQRLGCLDPAVGLLPRRLG